MANPSGPHIEVTVDVYKDNLFAPKKLRVIRELPVTLVLGDKEVVTLLYNGQEAEELTAGFFFSEGFLDRADQVRKLSFDPKQQVCRLEPIGSMDFFEDLWGKRMITSGCGKGSVFYHVMDSVSAGKIRTDSTMSLFAPNLLERSREVFRPSELYRETHGVHAAALCTADRMLLFREDIGRHNALDKIAGRCLLDSLDRSDKILFTTGRLTSEVMIKAGRLGVPIVVSRSSATDLALNLAGKIGITVVGGARGGSFLIYTGAQRIVAG